MANDVDLVNLALGHIGADAVVVAIDPPDGSAEAGHAARVYPIARRELLDMHLWSFAKKRAQLAQVTNTSSVWAFAYALPSDCLNAVRVLTLDVIQVAGFFPFLSPFPLPEELGLYTERGSADFTIEGTVLRTNQPQAVLIYIADQIDANRFSPSFFSALSILTASYLAGPIIKSTEGANTAMRLRSMVYDRGGLAGKAMMNDANSGSEAAEYLPAAIAVRA